MNLWKYYDGGEAAHGRKCEIDFVRGVKHLVGICTIRISCRKIPHVENPYTRRVEVIVGGFYVRDGGRITEGDGRATVSCRNVF